MSPIIFVQSDVIIIIIIITASLKSVAATISILNKNSIASQQTYLQVCSTDKKINIINPRCACARGLW